jgi:hypothetical protein
LATLVAVAKFKVAPAAGTAKGKVFEQLRPAGKLPRVTVGVVDVFVEEVTRTEKLLPGVVVSEVY